MSASHASLRSIAAAQAHPLPEHYKRLILAIDYDETLDMKPWPEVGRIDYKARLMMKLLHAQGHQLIIWTCREGDAQQAALANLRSQGVPFARCNENCPEMIKKWGSDSRKIFAHLYLDDKAALHEGIDWLAFYYQVQALATN
jgi:hypothetical protein